MRSLGLDIGDKRIGVALSDPQGILASPFTIIECQGDVMDAEAYIVKLMDTLDMYFDPIDDYTDDPEGEFDELDNENPRVYQRVT